MIQAPQTQYVPSQAVQTGAQQQGANSPVQTQPVTSQTAGSIYNYPQASSYMPNPQQNKAQYNGVNIEILNPQGQGGVGASQQGGISSNSNGQFNGVNLEIRNPQGQGVTPMYPNLMPAQFVPLQQQPLALPPAPQAVETPLTQPVQQPAQTPVPVIQTPVNEQPQQAVAATTPVVAEPQQQVSDIKPEVFAGRLKTDNLDDQKTAIEDIATKVKILTPEEIQQQGLSAQDVEKRAEDSKLLLDTQIFDALVDIINKDTSSLAGPTPEELQQREKMSEEEKKNINYSPLEKAEVNKQYALYTISYMQARLNERIEKAKGQALELKDLPCIDTVVDTAKENQNPSVRVAALASLSQIGKPEYAKDLHTIFDLAKADEDQDVKDVANKADTELTRIVNENNASNTTGNVQLGINPADLQAAQEPVNIAA